MKKIILPYSLKEGFISDARNVPTIEITENGSYDVKAYEVANVNVAGGGGSSDLEIATMTIINTQEGDVSVTIAHTMEEPFIGSVPDRINYYGASTNSINVILYKGNAYGFVDCEEVVSVEGDVEVEDGDLVVTGDCTITVKGYPSA